MNAWFDGKVFAAETAGTFGLLVAATGSIVYDGIYLMGLWFVVLMHLVGLWILVSIFGKYSMAHFNPAVTLGFAITGHARWRMVPCYVAAQLTGAIPGSMFVLHILGNHAELGLNRPDYSYQISLLFGIEVAATILLMGAILCIINTKVHGIVAGLVVGSVVAADVWFFGPISGASMNPIRSFAPALVTGVMHDMWFYVAAPLVGAAVPALIYRWHQHH